MLSERRHPADAKLGGRGPFLAGQLGQSFDYGEVVVNILICMISKNSRKSTIQS